MKNVSPEEETLEKIKLVLSCNNDAQAIKLIEQYGEWTKKKTYTEEDMINASKYGYEFHKTTSFPDQEFKDSCVNNTKQWLTTFKK